MFEQDKVTAEYGTGISGLAIPVTIRYCFNQKPWNNVNRINPKKLLNSKWTAAAPRNKEKHFLVTAVEFDEEGLVMNCEIEAVMSKRAQPIQWQELKDSTQWLHGWQ